jgi:hypothetical protein
MVGVVEQYAEQVLLDAGCKANAIMHRRGELTHSQRKQDVYDRLAAA